MIKNILITSVGRRVSLVRNFQKTIKSYNPNAKVFTCDMNPKLSAAAMISDGYFKVPRVSDKDYIKILKDICISHDISIIVPTIDTELSILASVKDKFLEYGVFIAISSKEICDTFYLKDTTEKFFHDNGFLTTKNISDLNSCKYPIFAKLNNSSCSIGAMVVYTKEEAKNLAKDKNYIFQEYIDSDEYTVDVFIDKNKNVISIIPRLRMEVRAGEVSKAKTIKDQKIINEIKRLCDVLDGAYGVLSIQLFKRDGEIIFIEINPRFGGGYPLSYLSGADFASHLIMDFMDKKLEYKEDWKDNNIMLRYDSEVIVDGNSI